MAEQGGEVYVFGLVSSTAAAEAFSFHQDVARSNEHIWPRTEHEIEEYARNGQLFGVRQTKEKKFVGLCYAVLGDDNEWELGGLTVTGSVQDLGIGTFLVRFALAHTMVFQSPWQYGQEVIAYVHEDNPDPRNVLRRLGFVPHGRIEVPGRGAPPSMKRNAAGNLVGDKFRFTARGLRQLSQFFNEDFDGTLRRSGAVAVLELGRHNLDHLRSALRGLVDSLSQ